MIEAAEQALANFQHEQAMAQAHAHRADIYLGQFLSLVGQRTGDRPTGQSIKCVREWTRWLSDNGPELKPIIQEETGIKFTERGTPHTFLWDDAMADDPDDALPPNAICRMQGPPNADGKGRPPMIYFLWSQRWDVHHLFGVGPVQPWAPEHQAVVDTYDGGTLTGVVQPPPLDDGWTQPAPSVTPMVEGEEQTFDWSEPPFDDTAWPEVVADSGEREAALEPEPERPRCATMEEWDALHAAFFDGMVASESKPSEGQRDFLRATLPVDAEPNAALAIAYRQAVERSRQ